MAVMCVNVITHFHIYNHSIALSRVNHRFLFSHSQLFRIVLQEQSSGIGAALNKHENWLDQKKLQSSMVLKGKTKPLNHVRIEDRFRVLYNTDGWE